MVGWVWWTGGNLLLVLRLFTIVWHEYLIHVWFGFVVVREWCEVLPFLENAPDFIKNSDRAARD